jgi:hypothetical protein
LAGGERTLSVRALRTIRTLRARPIRTLWTRGALVVIVVSHLRTGLVVRLLLLARARVVAALLAFLLVRRGFSTVGGLRRMWGLPVGRRLFAKLVRHGEEKSRVSRVRCDDGFVEWK